MCVLFVKLLHRYVIKHRLVKPLPPLNKPSPLTPDLIERLLDLDRSSASSSEPTEWLNSLTQWIVTHLIRPIPSIHNLRRLKQAETIVDLRRHPLIGPFISLAEIKDYDAGASLPIITNIRTLARPNVHSADSPLVFAMDVEYDGGIGFLAEYRIVPFNIPIRLSVRVVRLKGRMLLVFRRNAYYYGFVDNDHSSLSYSLQADIVFGEVGHGDSVSNNFCKVIGLDWLLQNYLVKKAFKRRFVLPGMKGKWWVDKPEQPPYPWSNASTE